MEARTLTNLFRKPPSPEIEVLMFLRGNQKDIYIYIHVHLPRMSLTMLTSVSLGSRSWCRGQSRLKGLMTPGAGRCGTPSTWPSWWTITWGRSQNRLLAHQDISKNRGLMAKPASVECCDAQSQNVPASPAQFHQ